MSPLYHQHPAYLEGGPRALCRPRSTWLLHAASFRDCHEASPPPKYAASLPEPHSRRPFLFLVPPRTLRGDAALVGPEGISRAQRGPPRGLCEQVSPLVPTAARGVSAGRGGRAGT